MWVAVDTDILVYAEGLDGLPRRDKAWATIDVLDDDDIVIPAQVLGELFNVLTRKAKWPAINARDAVQTWSDSYRVAETSQDVVSLAIGLSAAHQLTIWDAVILAAAGQAHCATLLSEDMQHGFAWRGVTVRNPFLAP